MYNRAKLPAVLVAALAFGAAPALAAASGQAATPDIAGFSKAKITLDQAIAAAQKQVAGKATSADFVRMDGKTGYIVGVLADNQTKDVWVNPQSGEAALVSTPNTSELNILPLNKTEMADAQNATTSLQQAVSMADRHSGGKAVAADIQDHGKMAAYNVQTLRDGKLSTIWVNPINGHVTG